MQETSSTMKLVFDLAAMSAAGALPYRSECDSVRSPPTPQGSIE
jgi:hypothetical protein